MSRIAIKRIEVSVPVLTIESVNVEKSPEEIIAADWDLLREAARDDREREEIDAIFARHVA